MKRYRITVLAAVLGALEAFALLTPSGGNDSNPPECYSYFGYIVPCGFGPEQSQGAGFAARTGVTGWFPAQLPVGMSKSWQFVVAWA